MNQIEIIDAIESESTEAIVEQAEVVEADGQIVLPGMPELIEEAEAPLTIEEIVDSILSAMKVTEATIDTLYFLHKIVNNVLEALDAKKVNNEGVLVSYRVISQMMYNYGRQGSVVKGRKLTGQDRINGLEMRAFAIKFCKKFM